MACRGCLECLLKLLNFLLTVSGLAMVGYGIYLLVEWKKYSDVDPVSPVGAEDLEFITLGRPMLLVASLSTSILDKLPRAWQRRNILKKKGENTKIRKKNKSAEEADNS